MNKLNQNNRRSKRIIFTIRNQFNLIIMDHPECTLANLALPMQIVFNLLSFAFALATVILITKHKLYRNSFTFLLLITQTCYLLISALDLLTAATTFNNTYIIWCKVVSPFIYGAILSSFLLIQLFVVLVYKTILDGGQGWLYRNIRAITLFVVMGAVMVNCVGIPFYGIGFCNSCGFEPTERSTYVDLVEVIILGDFYLPMALMLPVFFLIFHLILKKRRDLFRESSDLGCKILAIPLANFALLTISGTTGYIKNLPPLLYTFLFESIYLVSIINFIFYRCFINFFQLQDRHLSSKACCGRCFNQDKNPRDTQLTYFYDDRKNSD